MGRSRLSAVLLPPGLIAEQVQIDDGGLAVIARAGGAGSSCPDCGAPSQRGHSRYVQSCSICLPMAGASGSRLLFGGSGAGTTAVRG